MFLLIHLKHLLDFPDSGDTVKTEGAKSKVKKDAYFQHKTREIEELESLLASKKAALEDYVQFKSGIKPARGVNIKTASHADVDRKALRTSGRARDIFEYLYQLGKSASFEEIADATSYEVRAIQQFYFRYQADDLIASDGEKIFLTAKGRQLVEKSAPYAGKGK
jgi:hypothetical protein